MQEDPEPEGECEDAEFVITTNYEAHVQLFRQFADMTNEWLLTYEQKMAPMIMRCLSSTGANNSGSSWQLLNDLTSHAENFARLTQRALAEYEEAKKTADAIFERYRPHP